MKKFNGNDIPKDYPRPQMARQSFVNLNGTWEYAIRDDNDIPVDYDGLINVPFSPESRLSGVGRIIMPNQCIWYHRELRMEEENPKGRFLLHFGAVDQEAWVYINGFLTAHHGGGYHPFTVDVTRYLSADNDITVKVKDYTEYGRFIYGGQRIGGHGRRAQSGIWQTVWIENVPENYIGNVMVKPLFDKKMVRLKVIAQMDYMCTAFIGKQEITFPANTCVEIKPDKFVQWTPEHPYLYGISFEMEEDRVQSYFGMRKFAAGRGDDGKMKFLLNNRPYNYKKIIDTGYYRDGIYTPSCDAEMVKRITAAKKNGYNMIKKSGKVEPLRWYYHCDRIGMLVLQEELEGNEDCPREYREIKRTLGNTVSVVKWAAVKQY